METQKILNLLNSSENKYLKFATRKWYIIDSETKLFAPLSNKILNKVYRIKSL